MNFIKNINNKIKYNTKIEDIDGIGRDTIKKLHELNIYKLSDLTNIEWKQLATISHIGTDKIVKLYSHIEQELNYNQVSKFKSSLEKQKINCSENTQNNKYKIKPPQQNENNIIDDIIDILEKSHLNDDKNRQELILLMVFADDNKMVNYNHINKQTLPFRINRDIINDLKDVIPNKKRSYYNLNMYDIPNIDKHDMTSEEYVIGTFDDYINTIKYHLIYDIKTLDKNTIQKIIKNDLESLIHNEINSSDDFSKFLDLNGNVADYTYDGQTYYITQIDEKEIDYFRDKYINTFSFKHDLKIQKTGDIYDKN